MSNALRWGWTIAGCAVLGILVLCWVYWLGPMVNPHDGNTAAAGPSASSAQTDPPLKWRTLLSMRANNADGQGSEGTEEAWLAVVGDFDGDGDEEVLAIGVNKSVMYEVDGSTTDFPLKLEDIGDYWPFAWDCDRDGVAEIVPSPWMYFFNQAQAGKSEEDNSWESPPGSIPVVNLNGDVICEITAGMFPLISPLVLDIDGDGENELILPQQYPTSSFKAFGKNGAVVWDYDSSDSSRPSSFCAGDFDGDGADEYIMGPKNFVLYDHADGETQLGSWIPFRFFKAATDLTGDGKDELISAAGFADLATGTYTKFAYPNSTADTAAVVGDAVTLDFGDGQGIRVVTATSYEGGDMSMLRMFTATGDCTHSEQLDGDMLRIAPVHAGGSQYLLVQTTKRIMISP